MRKITIVIVGLLLAALTRTSAVSAVASTNVAQQRVNTIIEQLRRSEIERVEILAIPGRILTPIAVSAADIEKDPNYRLIVRDIREELLKGQLSRALASLAVEPSSDGGDIRWGVVFYDTHGQRIAGIFFDRDGKHGTVDSQSVAAKGDFVKWLGGMFSECFP